MCGSRVRIKINRVSVDVGLVLHCSHHIFAPPSPEDVGRLVCAQWRDINEMNTGGPNVGMPQRRTDLTTMTRIQRTTRIRRPNSPQSMNFTPTTCPSPLQRDVGQLILLNGGKSERDRREGHQGSGGTLRIRFALSSPLTSTP